MGKCFNQNFTQNITFTNYPIVYPIVHGTCESLWFQHGIMKLSHKITSVGHGQEISLTNCTARSTRYM